MLPQWIFGPQLCTGELQVEPSGCEGDEDGRNSHSDRGCSIGVIVVAQQQQQQACGDAAHGVLARWHVVLPGCW